jgi:hypothetical protein
LAVGSRMGTDRWEMCMRERQRSTLGAGCEIGFEVSLARERSEE